MQGEEITDEELDEIEEWLNSHDGDDWERALDSLDEDQFEALEARTLWKALKSRYRWDIFKLFFLVAYPIIWILIFAFQSSLPPNLPEWVPSSINSLWNALLQTVPAIGSIVITLFMGLLQFRNVKHFRDNVMPIAEEIRERKIAVLE